jgi:glycosyltransferase involved in cell wall biosynthesis
LFASLLTEGLVARGHCVTLFATGDSQTAATLSSVIPRGWSDDRDVDPKVAECLHIAAVFERADEFDVIHNSFDFLPLTYSGLVTTPVVTTIHGFSSPRILEVYERYNRRTAYVAISHTDRDPRLDYVATIHHGIDTNAFDLQTGPGGYLLFFGRIHPDKGTSQAIDLAARTGLRLLIAGIVQDQRYFDEAVAPRVDGDRVQYLGPIGHERRSELLGGARALLHLIDFDEPFGFSVVEAMACGTPVIAYDRGSMGELIDDGVTGMIVADLDAATKAVAQVHRLDRAAIRATAVRRFGRDRMVDEYVAVYEHVLAEARRVS